MANLLGDLWSNEGEAPPWCKVLEDGSVSLHLYGKATAKPGRKMGHLTMTGDSIETLIQRIHAAREQLER